MPAVSATQIAFCYAGDIWLAPKEGGEATRVSSPRGLETFPRFSPDGQQLAFTGNYDGNEDVYVMPVAGGEPRRLTFHGASDRLIGWYPDGRALLFASNRNSFTDRVGQLFRVSVTGGAAEQLPLAYAEFAALSPNGEQIAFTTSTTDFSSWKRYRGGMAPDIWLYDFAQHTSLNLTRNDATDSQPMWHGDTLYFVSDRDPFQRLNLWACDLKTHALRQVTHYTDSDVHFPSIGPADIVFENRGRLYLLELAGETTHEVEVRVVTDCATTRPRVESAAPFIRNGAISPTGKRVAFEARGEIFTVPVGEGFVRNLTGTSGAAERYPAWSPDGRWIAYFSDATGEYELTIRPSNGAGEAQTLTHLGAGWRYTPQWSPDSTKIVFADSAMRVRMYDFDSKQVTEIDRQLWQYHSDLDQFRVSWSSDSRWLAYAKDLENRQSAIVLYDLEEGKKHQVTSGVYDDDLPAIDPEGRYLFYRSRRAGEPIYADADNTWVYANGEVLVCVPLRDEIVSPLAPRNEEEPMRLPMESAPMERPGVVEKAAPAGALPARSESAPEESPLPAAELVALSTQRAKPLPSAKPEPRDDSSSTPPAPKSHGLQIDLDDFEARAVILPIGAGRFDHVVATGGKVLFTREPRSGAGSSARPLCYYDLDRREEATILDDVSGVDLSADGRKLLAVRCRCWSVCGVGAEAHEKGLALGEMELTVEPRAEWRQIFNDAWRMERDFFYDPQMHGVDWPQMRERYGRLLDDCVTRWDVNYVLGEMLGELSSSHVYRGGGDFDESPTRNVGYLGCDFALEEGAYRIAHILEVAAWDYGNRPPLRQPGVRVKEGDFVLAVNGRRLDPAQDPLAAFQGLADKTVQLTVNSRPTLEGARQVLVTPAADESRMRQLAWMEKNRRAVERASGGRVGYIYVRNTGVEGQGELYRQFRAQFDKAALIIDERWNSGGQVPDRFIELLGRRVTNFWGVRDGHDWQTPSIAHSGPKAMLVNNWSGSGGDALPWMFRQAQLGPVIGQRTWGGLIGMTGVPLLTDGGHVTVPTFSIYDKQGSWIIENTGVTPDLVVEDDPALLAKGEDPQLTRAITEMLTALQTQPLAMPKRPAAPNRAGVALERHAAR